MRMITCGTDGDIRIWAGFDDDDPIQTCVGEWSLCVRQKGQHLQIATDNNDVQLVTYPQGDRDGILMRFTAPVNHMAVGKNHELIAIASEDMEVKVTNLKGDGPTLTFPGLTGPPLSVSLCPKGKLLAVSSGDGQLRIFNVESQTLVKEFCIAPVVNSFMNANLLCRMDFDPTDGTQLAYPEKNTIVIVNTTDWLKLQTLRCNSVESHFSIVQFSPCGEFLAGATRQGEIAIWNVSSQSLVEITTHPKSSAICGLAWNPSGNGEIAFCDVQGQFGILINCSSSPEIESEKPQTAESEVDFGDIGIESDDDNDENVVSIEKLKKEIMGDGSEKDEEESRAVTPRPRTPETPLQEVFMPSSTPEHLNPRYLCWNEVGIVRSYGSLDDEESSKSIEVEFHDSTFHNSMMLQNYQNYTMGTVSPAALSVANSTQINVIPLSGAAKEWNLTVEEHEEIICIACSKNLVAFATNNYLIRVSTIYGIQRAIFSVPGPLVSMAAFENFLIVAYHSSPPRKGDQSLSMALYKFEGLAIESKLLPAALTPESTLYWLGFTDLGTPCSVDSAGMLYAYPLKSNVWIPICDLTKHRSSPADGFFVTAVYETLQAIRGIKCRGGIYPGFTPRPTQVEIEMQPPFAELGTEKSQLEASLFTWSTLQVEGTEKKYKETALKAFALACKNNLDQRALELVEMLGNSQLLTLALKYASKMDKRRLSEKLVEIASKLNAEEEDMEVSTISTPVSTPTLKPINRKVTLSHSKYSKGATPTTSRQEVKEMSQGNESVVDSQESFVSAEEPANPFLKSLKKKDEVYNPLSLTDRSAGVTFEKKGKEKENNMNLQQSEKRKQPETDADATKQKEKQRRLDKFMFSKR